MSENEINYNYLDLLNPQQRAAVEYKDGPALVIAGAGSGKTRVLTYKIVDLLAYGYEPWRVLALTFTNKAAREMKERVSAVVGEKVAHRLWMGTFHSIFLRILRQHADKIGMNPGFTVYDSTDSKSLIKSIIKDLNLDDKKYKANTIAAVISNAKNALITPGQYLADKTFTDADRHASRPFTAEIYRQYVVRCKLANAMDFDDILMYMNFLLRDHPDVLRHYQEYFRYILVDEYQDTNFAQHLVISQLAKISGKVCVVGDDAQSIYSFRGANIHNILNLERQFPGLKIFKLERNYRSTQNIINAAGSLIDKNTKQMKKHVYSENEEGEPITVINTYSDLEEAALVATRIQQSVLTRHDSYDDYAILYRTNAQSRSLEEALRNRNIPYRIYGGIAFYQRKEVKDAICYFRLAINPDDDEALRRIINYPARGIGETTLKKLISAAMSNNVSIFNVIKNLEKYQVPVNKGTAAKLKGFSDIISDINLIALSKDALDVARYVYDKTGILRILTHDKTPEAIARQENLTELLSAIKVFVDTKTQSGEDGTDLKSFLSEVFLTTDQDQPDDDNNPKVTLMTVHASKGLEFKHVIIIGVEEELFPSAMSMSDSDSVEEERRLMYVAVTRAKETCTITYAGTRFRNGQTTFCRPSRFIKEMNRKYLKIHSSSSIGMNKGYTNPKSNYFRQDESRQPFSLQSYKSKESVDSSFISKTTHTRPVNAPTFKPNVSAGDFKHRSAGELYPGMRIAHQMFGEGIIQNIERNNSEEIIIVEFANVGTKRLMLRFAQLAIRD
ncbi:MAG: exodeoxyribonuclease V subunit gamma [Prevotella sp.]|nr:exodeoxyribonuclease V subunit gamma [Bacteroides sp.]MCM1365909.1 exodeoxyribonuclease V subunit gamma [Prevotella sp.]